MNEYKAGDRGDRPWGSWLVISAAPGFAVKQITVNPGGILSLQRHRHRGEHWIIVRGTARVTLGERGLDLAADAHIYIPAGTWHRVANPGKTDLTFIEIQTGSILSEADIERRADAYGRAPKNT